jgi:hypothetical protein
MVVVVSIINGRKPLKPTKNKRLTSWRVTEKSGRNRFVPYVDAINGVQKDGGRCVDHKWEETLEAHENKEVRSLEGYRKKWEESICALCGRDKWCKKRWCSLCRSQMGGNP